MLYDDSPPYEYPSYWPRYPKRRRRRKSKKDRDFHKLGPNAATSLPPELHNIIAAQAHHQNTTIATILRNHVANSLLNDNLINPQTLLRYPQWQHLARKVASHAANLALSKIQSLQQRGEGTQWGQEGTQGSETGGKGLQRAKTGRKGAASSVLPADPAAGNTLSPADLEAHVLRILME